MLKILIADDHPLYREALIAALQPKFERVKFLESDSLDSVLACAKSTQNLSLILLDLNMPGSEDFYGLLKLKEILPEVPIVVISAHDDKPVVSQVMSYGAIGFVSKASPTNQLVLAIEAALKGKTFWPRGADKTLLSPNDERTKIAQQLGKLTRKQSTILTLLRQGLKNKEIADTLSVTEATVKAHLGGIFKHLDVTSRTQALIKTDKLKIE